MTTTQDAPVAAKEIGRDRRRKDHQPSRHPCHPTMLRHSRTSYRSCTSYPFRDDPATGVVDATIDLRPLFA